MISTIAYYYNGSTSAKHEVELFFNDRLLELSFTPTSNVKRVWLADNMLIERFDSIIEIRNTSDAGAVLQVSDELFIRTLLERFQRNGKLSFYHKLTNQKPSFYVVLTLFLVSFLAVTYFIIMPYVAEKSVVFLPKSFDTYMGDVFINNYRKHVAIDSIKTQQLNVFAQQIDFGNADTLHFIVVQSSEVNAFSLPNGNVVVYTGLLDKLQHYDELAGLLGHEVAHINHRHGVKMLMRNLSGYVFMSLVFTDINGVMAILVENAQNLQNLSYSRTFEHEADKVGVELMVKNNINPIGMVRLFDRIDDNTLALPEIVSTHPLTEDRKTTIRKHIESIAYSVEEKQSLQNLFYQLTN